MSACEEWNAHLDLLVLLHQVQAAPHQCLYSKHSDSASPTNASRDEATEKGCCRSAAAVTLLCSVTLPRTGSLRTSVPRKPRVHFRAHAAIALDLVHEKGANVDQRLVKLARELLVACLCCAFIVYPRSLDRGLRSMQGDVSDGPLRVLRPTMISLHLRRPTPTGLAG